jgi:hypothetical protein
VIADRGPHQAGERGVEIVEFIGIMPWLLVIAMVIWQLLMFGQAMLVAAGAAGAGARSVAAHRDCSSVVSSSVVGFKQTNTCPGGCTELNAVGVVVTVKLPIVNIPYVPLPPINLPVQAVYRCELEHD